METEKIEAVKEFEEIKDENKFSKKARQIHDKLISHVKVLLDRHTQTVTEGLSTQTKALTSNLDGNVANLNNQIQAFEKRMQDKYGNLYSHLIQVFLVNLESRVFSSEIFTQAMLEMMMRGFYKAKFNVEEVDESSEQWKEFIKAGAKEHALIQNVMSKNYSEKLKEKQAEEAANEQSGVEDVESIQEGKEAAPTAEVQDSQ